MDETVAAMVRRGWRIESQLPTQTVVAYGKPVNHILHLLLSIVTAGLWLIIWLTIGLTGGVQRRAIYLDADGSVVVGKL